MTETRIEFGLKSVLYVSVRDSLPRLHRLPDEHDRDFTGPRVIEPDIFRQKRNSIEPIEQRFAQSPDVMVDAQELIQMSRLHGEDEYLDRESFGPPIRISRLAHTRIIFVDHRRGR